MNANANVLFVSNRRQVVLFNTELQGQISDGKWENIPGDHWVIWCHVNPVVNPSNVGKTFWAKKDNYCLNAKDLLDVVGERMMVAVRLDQSYGEEGQAAFSDLFDWDGNFRGMPKFVGDHWDKVRAKISAQLEAQHATLEEVEAVGTDVLVYDRKKLNEDLKDLRKCFKADAR